MNTLSKTLLIFTTLAVSLTLSAPALAETKSADVPEQEKMPLFYEHLRKGKALLEDDQLEPALQEFQNAYAISRKPITAYYIARIHHKLGNREVALGWYQNYMKEASAVEPERKAQIEKYILELGGDKKGSEPPPLPPPPSVPVAEPAKAPPALTEQAPQPAPQPGPAPQYRSRRNVPMLASGVAMAGLGYIATVIVGGIGISYTYAPNGQPLHSGTFRSADGFIYTIPNAAVPGYPNVPLDTLRNGSATLLVPVVGPFISAGFMTTPGWAVPMALVGGGAQLAGLALAIAGGIKRKVPIPQHPVAFLPYSSRDSAGMVLTSAF